MEKQLDLFTWGSKNNQQKKVVSMEDFEFLFLTKESTVFKSFYQKWLERKFLTNH